MILSEPQSWHEKLEKQLRRYILELRRSPVWRGALAGVGGVFHVQRCHFGEARGVIAGWFKAGAAAGESSCASWPVASMTAMLCRRSRSRCEIHRLW